MYMKYVITEKFSKLKENPYFEDTRAWHVYIDICCTHNVKTGLEVDIDKMMKEHSQDYDYYDDILLLMVDDSLLECVYFK